ncbi:uncharacterized protein DNG_09990 [Cephalotrichum gorgonifer]|uniref:C2H2-type domain-containing protein n=1 Tax=Cephalotrichum gorgonifer TaxID=2041049 RepID=A0AAE8N6S0_9PEZI|nr:uncharacterized protein DNG_09990 [Cephalotrichum gorgonifer]
MSEAPADVLKEARQRILGLMDLGISRETLFNLVATSNHSASPAPPPPTNGSNGSNVPQRPLPSQSGDSASREVKTEQIANDDGLSRGPSGMHWPKPNAFQHRPRISVSSTSSGSSGRASIWSSAPSFASTGSAATHFSQSSSPLQQTTTSPSTASNPQNAAQAGWPTGRLNFYWCTSCETRFKRKYDWKRHEEEFHERWKKYPCPEPGCNRSFWGANTFNQHHKSSHGCKSCPHSEQVVKYLRKRKYWACGFCAALHPSRERHVEHVARHFEAGKTKADWTHSRVIYGLVHQPLIHEAWKDILNAKQVEFAGRQAQFSWNPTKTGRAQGFMENECPGQLQDLLEFFSGSSADAEGIVRVAYELADVVFMTSPYMPPSTIVDTPAPPPPVNTTSYPTPPESTLSPVTPGSATMHAQPGQAQQQQHPQGMMLGEPTSPTAFTAPYGNPSMMQAPMFGQQNIPRPASGSLPLRRSSLERALPAPPPADCNTMASGPPTINIDYLQSGVGSSLMLEDWDSFTTTVVDEPMHQHGQMTTDWPAMPYFNPQQG